LRYNQVSWLNRIIILKKTSNYHNYKHDLQAEQVCGIIPYRNRCIDIALWLLRA